MLCCCLEKLLGGGSGEKNNLTRWNGNVHFIFFKVLCRLLSTLHRECTWLNLSRKYRLWKLTYVFSDDTLYKESNWTKWSFSLSLRHCILFTLIQINCFDLRWLIKICLEVSQEDSTVGTCTLIWKHWVKYMQRRGSNANWLHWRFTVTLETIWDVGALSWCNNQWKKPPEEKWYWKNNETA